MGERGNKISIETLFGCQEKCREIKTTEFNREKKQESWIQSMSLNPFWLSWPEIFLELLENSNSESILLLSFEQTKDGEGYC